MNKSSVTATSFHISSFSSRGINGLPSRLFHDRTYVCSHCRDRLFSQTAILSPMKHLPDTRTQRHHHEYKLYQMNF